MFRALMVLAVALGLSACQPSGNNSRLEQVNFVIDWDPEPTYLGIYYAKSLGLFEEAGYDVQIVSLRGANAVVQAVAGGQNPIGTASGGATAIGVSNGNRTVSLAVLYPNISTVVYGHADERVSRPTDLYGKTVAIYPTSITRNEFEAFVRANNLDANRIRVVDAVGSDLEFLAQGQADGALNYAEMSPARLAISQDATRVDGRTSYELPLAQYGVTGYGLNIITSPAELERNGARVRALAAAAVEGYRRGCEDRAAAVEAFLLAVHRVETRMAAERPYVTASWDRVCNMLADTPGEQTEAGWATTIATYGGVGLLPNPVTPADIMAPPAP